MNDASLANRPWPWQRVAALLVLTNGLAMAPSLAYVPLIPMMKRSLALSFTQLGLFAGLSGIMAILLSVPAGVAIDSVGTRKVFLCGGAFMILGLLVLGNSGGFSGALAGRGIWQGGLRFALPAMTAAIVMCVPPVRRGSVLGTCMAVSMLLAIAAQNAAAYIGQDSGWRTAMFFFAGLVAVAAMIFYLIRDSQVGKSSTAAPASSAAVTKSPYRRSSVWALCLLVIFACEEGLVDNLAVVQMSELWHTGPVTFARIASLGMGLGILTNVAAGWIADRLGVWNVLIACGVLNTAVGACLLVGQAGIMPVFVAGILIAKALQLTTALLVNAAAPSFLGGKDVGAVIAVIALGGGMGQYVGPQVLGILRDWTHGYTAGWIFIVASGAAALGLSLGFKYYFSGLRVAAT